jgi:hypothetical protein
MLAASMSRQVTARPHGIGFAPWSEAVGASLRAMSRVVYYAAMSLDGYIAEADDTIEWLTGFEAVPPAEGVETVQGGYDEFYEGIGALVSGSVTYEWILGHIQHVQGGCGSPPPCRDPAE